MDDSLASTRARTAPPEGGESALSAVGASLAAATAPISATATILPSFEESAAVGSLISAASQGGEYPAALDKLRQRFFTLQARHKRASDDSAASQARVRALQQALAEAEEREATATEELRRKQGESEEKVRKAVEALQTQLAALQEELRQLKEQNSGLEATRAHYLRVFAEEVQTLEAKQDEAKLSKQSVRAKAEILRANLEDSRALREKTERQIAELDQHCGEERERLQELVLTSLSKPGSPGEAEDFQPLIQDVARLKRLTANHAEVSSSRYQEMVTNEFVEKLMPLPAVPAALAAPAASAVPAEPAVPATAPSLAPELPLAPPALLDPAEPPSRPPRPAPSHHTQIRDQFGRAISPRSAASLVANGMVLDVRVARPPRSGEPPRAARARVQIYDATASDDESAISVASETRSARGREPRRPADGEPPRGGSSTSRRAMSGGKRRGEKRRAVTPRARPPAPQPSEAALQHSKALEKAERLGTLRRSLQNSLERVLRDDTLTAAEKAERVKQYRDRLSQAELQLRALERQLKA